MLHPWLAKSVRQMADLDASASDCKQVCIIRSLVNVWLNHVAWFVNHTKESTQKLCDVINRYWWWARPDATRGLSWISSEISKNLRYNVYFHFNFHHHVLLQHTVINFMFRKETYGIWHTVTIETQPHALLWVPFNHYVWCLAYDYKVLFWGPAACPEIEWYSSTLWL